MLQEANFVAVGTALKINKLLPELWNDLGFLKIRIQLQQWSWSAFHCIRNVVYRGGLGLHKARFNSMVDLL